MAAEAVELFPCGLSKAAPRTGEQPRPRIDAIYNASGSIAMLSVRFIMLFFCLAAAAAQDTIQKHLVAKIEGLVDGDAFLMKTRPLALALELLDAPAPGSLAVEVYRTTGEIETRSVEGHEACARMSLRGTANK